MSHPNAEAQKSSGGLMEDVIGIFVSPSQVFAHQRNKSFVMPVLIQMVIFIALAVGLKNLMAPFWDAEFARGAAKAAEKAAAAGTPAPPAGMMDTMQNVTYYSAAIVGPWITAIFGGIVLWLGGKIVGARMSVGQGMTIAAWAAMPTILGMIAMAVLGVMADPQTVRGMGDAQLGPARFLDPATASPAILALMTLLDVFNIWCVVLAGIGVAVVGGVSRGAGMVASVVKWGVSALFAVGGAIMRG